MVRICCVFAEAESGKSMMENMCLRTLQMLPVNRGFCGICGSVLLHHVSEISQTELL